MEAWSVFRGHLQRSAAVFAFLTNSLLIMLIVHRSPKSLGDYKYLMVFMAVFELAYAVIDFSVRPDIVTSGSFILVAVDSNLTKIPFQAIYFCLLVWNASFGVSLANFGVHFVYRYLVVVGETKWTSSGGFRIWLWMSISIVYGFVWALLIHFFEPKSEILDEFITKDVDSMRGTSIDDIVYVGFSFYQKTSGSGSEEQGADDVIDQKTVTGISLLILLCALSSGVMSYFAIKCYLAIRELSHGTRKSSKAKSLQSQLFFALLLQTAIPITLMHTPCVLAFGTALLGRAEHYPGKLLTPTIAVFPSIDPLPSMLIITAYRDAIIEGVNSLRTCGRSSRGSENESCAAPTQLSRLSSTQNNSF